MNAASPSYAGIRSEMRPAGLAWLRRYVLIGRDRAIEYIWAIHTALGVDRDPADIVHAVDDQLDKFIRRRSQNCRDTAIALLITSHHDDKMGWRMDKRADMMMYLVDVVVNWIIENETMKVLHLACGADWLELNPESADAQRLLWWFHDLIPNIGGCDFLKGGTHELVEDKKNTARGQEGFTFKVDSGPPALRDMNLRGEHRPSDEVLAALGGGSSLICSLTDGIGTMFHRVIGGQYAGPMTVAERRSRLLAGGETCHVQIFCPPWSVIMWDRDGNPRPTTDKLYGKRGWWVPVEDMIEHRVSSVVLRPRDLHAVIDACEPFDADALIDGIVAKAEREDVRSHIDAYLAAHPEIVAHGHD